MFNENRYFCSLSTNEKSQNGGKSFKKNNGEHEKVPAWCGGTPVHGKTLCLVPCECEDRGRGLAVSRVRRHDIGVVDRVERAREVPHVHLTGL